MVFYEVMRARPYPSLLYAVARLCSRFDVCSKALYYASYLFFYGGVMHVERTNPVFNHELERRPWFQIVKGVNSIWFQNVSEIIFHKYILKSLSETFSFFSYLVQH